MTISASINVIIITFYHTIILRNKVCTILIVILPSSKYPILCDCGAGPTGKVLLMPEDPNAVYIMVATGTGIAPYRAFWRRQFLEDVPNFKFTGLSWLFMGVANSDAKLYDDELQDILKRYPDQ